MTLYLYHKYYGRNRLPEFHNFFHVLSFSSDRQRPFCFSHILLLGLVMPSVVNVYWCIAQPGPTPNFGLEARLLCHVSVLTTCHCSLLLFLTLKVRTRLGDEEKWVLEVRRTKESPTSSWLFSLLLWDWKFSHVSREGEKTNSMASRYNSSTYFIPR